MRRRFVRWSAQRLRRRGDFQRVSRQGRRLSSRSFIVVAAQRAGESGPARLGLVVSKRVGRAVQRNRVKRVVREWFRARSDSFPAGSDLVVIARPPARGAKLREVMEQLDRAIERESAVKRDAEP